MRLCRVLFLSAVLAPFLAITSSGSESLPVETFFSNDQISMPALSPDGELVAYLSQREVLVGNGLLGYESIHALRDQSYVYELEWSGPRQLTVHTYKKNSNKPRFTILDIVEKDGGLEPGKKTYFSANGYVLDFKPDDPQQLLLVLQQQSKEGIKSDVFRINPYKDLKYQTGKVNRMNGRFDRAEHFVMNSEGQLFIALGYVSGRPVLFRQQAGRKKWKKLWSGDADTIFTPVSISSDHNTLYALTNATTDKIVVVAFDIGKKKIENIIYEHESVDIKHVATDPDSGQVIAARHEYGGISQYEFLDDSEASAFAWIKHKVNSQFVHIARRSLDGETYLAFTASSAEPATFYLCKKSQDTCDKIASTMPGLADIELSPVQEVITDSTDGLRIQSFLTLPLEGGDRIPLIVMPHGGPIGIQNSRQYNGGVQWLAHNGYAVLQGNSRGSGGFGKKFKSAGLREWGRGIEDDIEVSLANVLASTPQLDRGRVGIFGSSYGGYSALFSVIRSPEKYRCAASFAGVTDLTLLFNDNHMRRNERSRERLAEMIGDPKLEKNLLKQRSPVYNYRKIARPVFLAHGSVDSVVDVEHSWRLNQLLERNRQPVELHILDGVGHGFEFTNEVKQLYDPLMRFLDSHLKP